MRCPQVSTRVVLLSWERCPDPVPSFQMPMSPTKQYAGADLLNLKGGAICLIFFFKEFLEIGLNWDIAPMTTGQNACYPLCRYRKNIFLAGRNLEYI